MKLVQDPSNKTFNIITDSRFVITTQDIYDLISFLAFLANRSTSFTTCKSEIIEIDSEGKLSCSHPDPWVNKYFGGGCEFIGFANEIANLIGKIFPGLIDES